ncbi:hypothetical protein Q4511_06250 [Paracoccus sp. 1_MG-2023]|uniref:hypothetical protein n=1 Tax=unclassified Paracoccus (in: a-proteobacteria) TaxID=2688777 RepID=UPI001C093116|nr:MULTISPECIES: hypothetical protein [unclassified Paracoccus (in: a-proteobacteria)]MBU2958495.1 hypothetical protein [Paracoccus sp. C2R09]MDO6668520.1 hypothetical protein [Paracoccus sp. 1_MG-2023]
MTDRRSSKPQPGSREDRLAQALRANLARRKAQARARQAADQVDDNEDAPETGHATGKDS